jgi:hypothetical protein
MSIKKVLSVLGTVIWVGVLTWQLFDYFGGKGGGDQKAGEREVVSATVDEHDGKELVSLMRGANEAVTANDPRRFESLFAEPGAGKSAWSAVQRFQREYGVYSTGVVTTPPEIDRATTDVHLRALTMEAWYDFTRDHTVNGPSVAHTTWQFYRSDDGWKLDHLRIDTSMSDYSEIIPILMKMSYGELMSLNMDWEESVDPTPVLAGALRAIGRKDVEMLKRCAVGGVIVQAFDEDVELPDLYHGHRTSVRLKRKNAEKALYGQIDRLWRYCRKLESSPTGLIPYFTAYHVVSMPSGCTQLRFNVEFDGGGVPAPVESFFVEWRAAFVAHKWLAGSLQVKNIRRLNYYSAR